MAKLRIAGIVPESVVDGPGIRFTVFTQGCRHNCKGCQNPQTHDFNGGYFVDTDDLFSEMIENPLIKGFVSTILLSPAMNSSCIPSLISTFPSTS